MTQPLSWNLHGNDQLSGVLEKLDRTLDKLGRKLDSVSGDARQMGASLGSVESPARRLGDSADHASGRLDRLSERMSNAVSRAAQFGAALAAAAAVGVATLVGIGVKTASANEQAAISFELLLGNAERAAKFLAELQKFAAATPFEMPQLRTAASRLLAVGLEAQRVIPLLTALGDATSGMGTGAEGIERAVTALTQMRMKTKVTAEEMLQLTEAGIPAWQSLAAVLKVDVQTAMKMVEKRTVDANTMFQALETKAGPAMQRLGGMMEKQSASLSGVWSTFKDNAGQALAKFAEPALPALKKVLDATSTGLPKVLDAIRAGGGQIKEIFKDSDVPDRLTKSLEALGDRILPKLKESWDKIMDMVRDNREGLEKLGRFVADILIPIFGTSLITSIDMITGALQGIIFVSSKVVDAIKFMTQLFLANVGMILKGAELTWGWVPGLGDKLKEASAKFDEFANGVMAKLNALDGKTVTFNVQAKLSGSAAAAAVERSGGTYVSGRAVGGPVWEGMSYPVGEKGIEQFYAATSGTIRSNESLRNSMGRGGDEFLGTVRLELVGEDGKVMHEKLLKFKRNSGKVTLGLA